MRYWTSSHLPADGLVCITLGYLYDEVALDVDNILKPIQDALVGLYFPTIPSSLMQLAVEGNWEALSISVECRPCS